MKQVKFVAMIAMAVFLSISVTSCMKGDDNTISSGSILGKCVNIFPVTFQLADGQKMIFKDASSASLNEGEIYFFYFQYDRAVQDPNSNAINATFYGGSVPTSVNAKSSEGPMNTSGLIKPDAPIYVLNGYVENTPIQPAVGFDNDYLIIPLVFWLKVESTSEKQKEELDKHSFVLTYDDSKIEAGDTNLVLTLNHLVNDGSVTTPVVRDRYTSVYKAYKLSSALYAFQNKAGKKPTKIIIEAQTNSSKDSLEGATKQTWEYIVK